MADLTILSDFDFEVIIKARLAWKHKAPALGQFLQAAVEFELARRRGFTMARHDLTAPCLAKDKVHKVIWSLSSSVLYYQDRPALRRVYLELIRELVDAQLMGEGATTI